MTALASSLLGAAPKDAAWPDATAAKLPRWRGFNLTEKFTLGRGNQRFKEQDFRLISQWGFDFVRLPMDYRLWIVDKDWHRLNEDVLKEIDEAVELGKRYHIHVSINFHRAPGYCVNGRRDPEPFNLWQDEEAQEAFVYHWRAFAKRYKGIPSARLSFNLVNEPGHVTVADYLKAIAPAVRAIKEEDPDRLIISDTIFGVDDKELGDGLKTLGVAFSPHQYWPSQITHYKASWVDRHGTFPPPVWPTPDASGRLYAPTKPGVPHGALLVHGPFAQAAKLRLHLYQVSGSATVVVKADGKPVWTKAFVCGDGEGEWTKVVHAKQWDIYQNIFDKDYTADIPASTREIQVEMTSGDWLILSELGLTVGGDKEVVQKLNSQWGSLPAKLDFVPGKAFTCDREHGSGELWEQRIGVWDSIRRSGVGTMVGEFGVFNKTPHDVALAWLEDNLKLFKKAQLGWALWNFRGGFGILDSGRSDVAYEDIEGHQLDRKMLEMLQRY
jgi:aryl-phospho-beta-D-glucosidase BglC (GH1 family)